MKMDTSRFDNYDNRSFQRFSNPALIEKDLQTLVVSSVVSRVTMSLVIQNMKK
jgi:hypothetical protein